MLFITALAYHKPYETCKYCFMSLKRKRTAAKEKRVVVVVWKGIHSGAVTNRTGAEGLSFYYPNCCTDQIHRVLSSKTVRPRAACGARYIFGTLLGHGLRFVHGLFRGNLQFGEEARPYLCMDEWNRPTPIRRRRRLLSRSWGHKSLLLLHMTDRNRNCQNGSVSSHPYRHARPPE